MVQDFYLNITIFKFFDHILKAHKSGADLIKIQTYEPNDITVNSKKKKFLIKDGLWKGKKLWNLYKKASTPYSWHADAFKFAKKIGATLFSTPFSPRAVDFLEKLNVPIYKLASLEITDFQLINKIAKTKKPILISTGSANFQEIKLCLNIVRKYHNKIILMHCVSDYPTDNKNANIGKISELKKKFNIPFIGLSDHTQNIFSSVAASALNVVAIEKHFKNSGNLKSLDSAFSIDPRQLRLLKNFAFRVHESLSTTKKNEFDKKQFRRSIYASKEIKKNEKLTSKNIIALRPKIGLCASNYFKILNKKSKNRIQAFSPIYRKNIH